MEDVVIDDRFSPALMILPLVVLTLSVALLVSRRWRALLLKDFYISGFLVTQLALNLQELVTFGNLNTHLDFTLRIYFTLIIFVLSFFVCLSDRLNDREIIPRKVLYSLIVLVDGILISLLFGSDLIIAGVVHEGNWVSRIPGDLYFISVSYLLICVIGGLYLILRSIIDAPNPLDRKRHTVILFSLLPLTISSILVAMLMQLGFRVNLALVLPVCTFIFLVVYLFTETKHNLFHFLVNIPFSKERAAYKTLNKQVIDYISKTQTDEKLSLKELMHEIESAFITNALEIKDGNHNLAAELLSTSASTIYRRKKTENGKP